MATIATEELEYSNDLVSEEVAKNAEEIAPLKQSPPSPSKMTPVRPTPRPRSHIPQIKAADSEQQQQTTNDPGSSTNLRKPILTPRTRSLASNSIEKPDSEQTTQQTTEDLAPNTKPNPSPRTRSRMTNSLEQTVKCEEKKEEAKEVEDQALSSVHQSTYTTTACDLTEVTPDDDAQLNPEFVPNNTSDEEESTSLFVEEPENHSGRDQNESVPATKDLELEMLRNSAHVKKLAAILKIPIHPVKPIQKKKVSQGEEEEEQLGPESSIDEDKITKDAPLKQEVSEAEEDEDPLGKHTSVNKDDPAETGVLSPDQEVQITDADEDEDEPGQRSSIDEDSSSTTEAPLPPKNTKTEEDEIEKDVISTSLQVEVKGTDEDEDQMGHKSSIEEDSGNSEVIDNRLEPSALSTGDSESHESDEEIENVTKASKFNGSLARADSNSTEPKDATDKDYARRGSVPSGNEEEESAKSQDKTDSEHESDDNTRGNLDEDNRLENEVVNLIVQTSAVPPMRRSAGRPPSKPPRSYNYQTNQTVNADDEEDDNPTIKNNIRESTTPKRPIHKPPPRPPSKRPPSTVVLRGKHGDSDSVGEPEVQLKPSNRPPPPPRPPTRRTVPRSDLEEQVFSQGVTECLDEIQDFKDHSSDDTGEYSFGIDSRAPQMESSSPTSQAPIIIVKRNEIASKSSSTTPTYLKRGVKAIGNIMHKTTGVKKKYSFKNKPVEYETSDEEDSDEKVSTKGKRITRKIEKGAIGLPQDFRHVKHVGWGGNIDLDNNTGSSLKVEQDIEIPRGQIMQHKEAASGLAGTIKSITKKK